MSRATAMKVFPSIHGDSTNEHQAKRHLPQRTCSRLGDSNMNLGQHLENGLTNLGNNIERIAEKHHEATQKRYEHDLESDRLGLITDEDKVKLLKQDLYRVARGRGEVTGLCRAIATIENSIQAKYQRDNDFIGKFNQIFNTAVVLTCIAILLSFLAYGLCGNSRMSICTNSTQLSRYLLNQFSESK